MFENAPARMDTGLSSELMHILAGRGEPRRAAENPGPRIWALPRERRTLMRGWPPAYPSKYLSWPAATAGAAGRVTPGWPLIDPLVGWTVVRYVPSG